MSGPGLEQAIQLGLAPSIASSGDDPSTIDWDRILYTRSETYNKSLKTRIAVPSKEMLQRLKALFNLAGIIRPSANGLVDFESVLPDIEFDTFPSSEIPYKIRQGVVDAGFTNEDTMAETGIDQLRGTTTIMRLPLSRATFSPIRICMGVPLDGKPSEEIEHLHRLSTLLGEPEILGKHDLERARQILRGEFVKSDALTPDAHGFSRLNPETKPLLAKLINGKKIGTEVPNLVRRKIRQMLELQDGWYETILSKGATEGMSRRGESDVLVDKTETGKSFQKTNHLRVFTFCESDFVMVGNVEEMRNYHFILQAIENLAMLTHAAIDSTINPRTRLEMMIPTERYDHVVDQLPAEISIDEIPVRNPQWRKTTSVVPTGKYPPIVRKAMNSGANSVIPKPEPFIISDYFKKAMYPTSRNRDESGNGNFDPSDRNVYPL